MDDLYQATTVGQEALGVIQLSHPDRAELLDYLASRLSMRYQHTGAVGDLNQAITLGQEALAATPSSSSHTDRAGCLSSQANRLSIRYKRTELSTTSSEPSPSDRKHLKQRHWVTLIERGFWAT